MQMTLGGALVLALDIYALYNVMSSDASAVGKVLWVILILLLPIFGFILWLLLGPRTKAR
ncbi:PLDc N-terminal domain-containing protein [Halocynthiibacter sp. SDUM655004]|uniref:PLDc N-terminal domain-containing protein n=2 Tax=Paracoccaceae TaxID=31989 RepID=A0AAE3IZG5_9RHOB|nr:MULTISPECIES: PLDc N-terminal domain-containing protein [Halocynthiibacter]MCV6824859.1 PLDc N-terminal domain-containing protein [Halocynthiibacter halioticoli]MCW4057860.1 PLDc N-terminal domain-containing protein [Halocynthiibacter sp. SDUM655004]